MVDVVIDDVVLVEVNLRRIKPTGWRSKYLIIEILIGRWFFPQNLSPVLLLEILLLQRQFHQSIALGRCQLRKRDTIKEATSEKKHGNCAVVDWNTLNRLLGNIYCGPKDLWDSSSTDCRKLCTRFCMVLEATFAMNSEWIDLTNFGKAETVCEFCCERGEYRWVSKYYLCVFPWLAYGAFSD